MEQLKITKRNKVIKIMTSEEIIQRLLDERKITVAEALVILKDIAKNAINTIFDNHDLNKRIKKDVPHYPNMVTVMYGVNLTDNIWYGETKIPEYSETSYSTNTFETHEYNIKDNEFKKLQNIIYGSKSDK